MIINQSEVSLMFNIGYSRANICGMSADICQVSDNYIRHFLCQLNICQMFVKYSTKCLSNACRMSVEYLTTMSNTSFVNCISVEYPTNVCRLSVNLFEVKILKKVLCLKPNCGTS